MPDMKKVCLVVQRYGAEVNGGAELLCRQMAGRLVPHYDVTVYTTTAKDYLTWRNEYPTGVEYIDGVRVERFPVEQERSLRRFRVINALLSRGMLPRGLENKWLDEQGPVTPSLLEAIAAHAGEFDAFVFHTYLYYPAVRGVPLVADKAVLVPDAHEEPPLHLGLVRDEFESAAGFFFNTAEERDLVLRTFDVSETPQEIGGAGVEIGPHPSPDEFRAKYGIEGHYVVYVGRVDEGKGCPEMLEWWSRYREAYGGELTLVLVGKVDIPLLERSDVKALGFISEEDKSAGIEGADFLWLPSRYESLSLVVLEALSLGVPVLVNGASDVLRAHCERSEAGFAYRDYDDCAQKMAKLLSADDDVALMRRNGPQYVQEHYQWSDIIDRLSRLIESVSGQTASKDIVPDEG